MEKLKKAPSSPQNWEEPHRLLWPFLMTRMYRKLGGNRYLAEEASQEVMLRVVRFFDFRDPSAGPLVFMKYLGHACNSVLIDLLRLRGRALAITTDLDLIEQHGHFHDVQPNPEEQALLQNALDQIGQDLRPKERKIAYLLLQGKTSKEIAENIGLEHKTILNLITIIRRKFRKIFFSPLPDNP